MTTVLAKPIDVVLREELVVQDRSRIFNLLNDGGFFTTREMAYAMNLLDGYFRELDNNDYRFVMLEKGDTLLGYGCYGLMPLCDGRYHIYWLAVDRAHRGHGIGTQLEAAIVKTVKKLGGVKLYAEVSNRGKDGQQQHFYANCGYNLASITGGYYADGDDRLLFEKDLRAKSPADKTR